MDDEETTNRAERKRLRQAALARWDNEGGAGSTGPQQDTHFGEAPTTPPALTDAEVVQLQIRVIALENLVIALLANAPDAARDQAREIAAYISPRSGFTQHRLTLHAATQMKHLVERAHHLSELTPKTELADRG